MSDRGLSIFDESPTSDGADEPDARRATTGRARRPTPPPTLETTSAPA